MMHGRPPCIWVWGNDVKGLNHLLRRWTGLLTMIGIGGVAYIPAWSDTDRVHPEYISRRGHAVHSVYTQ
jgi:hypothetical protein